LADGDVTRDVAEDCDDGDEPVDAGRVRHVVGTTSHRDSEERLGNTSVVEATDEDELTDEQQKKTVIDLGKGSLRLVQEGLLGLELRWSGVQWSGVERSGEGV